MTQQRNASCCENRAEAEMFAITLAGNVLNPRPLTRAREKAGKSGEKTYIRTRTRARPRTTRGKPRRDEEGVNFVWPLPPICAREHQCLSKRPSRPYRYKPHSYCRLSAQAGAQARCPSRRWQHHRVSIQAARCRSADRLAAFHDGTEDRALDRPRSLPRNPVVGSISELDPSASRFRCR